MTRDAGIDARTQLLRQLRHLIDEMELLAHRVERIEPEVLEARPQPDKPSIKELFGALIAQDMQALEHLREASAATINGDREAGNPVEAGAEATGDDWQAWDIQDLLGRVQSGRELLASAFEALPGEAWAEHDVPEPNGDDDVALDAREATLQIIRRDTEYLRSISRLFYESGLSGRA